MVVLARVGAQQQAARIHGTVIDADGRSVPSAAVELTDPLGAVLQQSTTAADGRFVFAGVAPGRFTIRTRPSGAAEHAASLSFTVEAALPLEVLIRLPPRVSEAVQVEGAIDAGSLRLSLAGESLASAPARIRGRSLQDAIATLPGWATEDNGLLHTRGVDDGFLYVIDGVPVYERLDALNGNAPDTQSLASISVITGYVAPEFGYKAGGVIEVQSQPATERWRGTLRPRSRQQCHQHARRYGWRQARTRRRLEARGLFPRSAPVSRPRSSRQPAQHRLAGHDVRRPRLRRRRTRSSDPRVDDRSLPIRRAEHRRTRSSGARPAAAGVEWFRHGFLAARVVGRHRDARCRLPSPQRSGARGERARCAALRRPIASSPGPGGSSG